MILLGKKTFWWRIKVILFAPFWLTYESPTKKSWDEYKHALISHKCEFDYDHPEVYKSTTFFNCRHYGCNMCTAKDRNGRYTWE